MMDLEKPEAPSNNSCQQIKEENTNSEATSIDGKMSKIENNEADESDKPLVIQSETEGSKSYLEEPANTTYNLEEPHNPKPDPDALKPVVKHEKHTVDPDKSSKSATTQEKSNIYKALAIKLKKELVKFKYDNSELNERVESLNKTNVNLEARAKILQQQLDSTENDLQALQIDYDNYKLRASEIMLQDTTKKKNINNTFEDNLYKQLKELNVEQQKRISILESQLALSLKKNQIAERTEESLNAKIRSLEEELDKVKNVVMECETLSQENEILKTTLKQTNSKEPSSIEEARDVTQSNQNVFRNSKLEDTSDNHTSMKDDVEGETNIAARLSPSASIKDHDSQTNSTSSFDGSTSGYVHIKPTTFEIISRSTVLEDTQNQLDSLTKAYLDSESTNSLLTEQIATLKEEIRRLQRLTDRMDLAENLEYLKNILFKFLTLDSDRQEQKERLIPVISTVLKLSPEETAKLQTLTVIERPSVTGSFFKL